MWFAFALISVFFAGLQSFLSKVVAEKGYDSYHVSASSSLFAFLVSGAVLLCMSGSIANLPAPVWWLAFVSGIVYTGRVITQFESLRFIHAAIFFPLYKVLGPAIVTILGIALLSDDVSPLELLGIVLSCLVPLLLITKAENHRQKNLRFGLILLLASTVLAALTTLANAAAVAPSESLVLPFITLAYGFSTVFGLLLYVRRYQPKEMYRAFKGHLTVSLISIGAGIGLLQFCSFYFFLRALGGLDVSIVYSINAHYIIIPVILAVWLYKEHWNLQKAFALAVSVLAIILLHPNV